ncbi:MAG: hypothetical protein EA396_10575 [Anaerolineaceae bacterium]|nr:MAG: hypothetical protein EA396_10575 [Anaerolineaceae bacterium]
MAYLNEREREKLLNDLSKMTFLQAKRRLRRMDRQAKLAVYRNVQNTGEWITRYDLVGKGTRVTLIEEERVGHVGSPDIRHEAEYELARVVVEPLPENRT